MAGERLAPGTLLYVGTGRDSIDISCRGAARLIVIGGVPFHEDILLWWNFVARRPEEIEQATGDWNAGAALRQCSRQSLGAAGGTESCGFRPARHCPKPPRI